MSEKKPDLRFQDYEYFLREGEFKEAAKLFRGPDDDTRKISDEHFEDPDAENTLSVAASLMGDEAGKIKSKDLEEILKSFKNNIRTNLEELLTCDEIRKDFLRQTVRNELEPLEILKLIIDKKWGAKAHEVIQFILGLHDDEEDFEDLRNKLNKEIPEEGPKEGSGRLTMFAEA